MNDELDKQMYDAVEAGMRRLNEAGMAPDKIEDVASEALSTAIFETANGVADRLVKTMPKMLRQHRRETRRFGRRVRRDWASSLDLLYAIVVCAEEGGAAINDNRPEPDYRFEAVTGILARACRTAFEVHHLLSAGYPLGALARSRTLHELAVNAMVIDTYGDPQGPCPDLAERYLLHGEVLRWQDAKAYQRHHATLGLESFSDEDMANWRDESDRLIATYGANFKEPYGWAAPLHASGRPNFSDLELLAESAHMRGHYKWASHEVHADARGSALNTFVVDGRRFRSTGSSNVGFSDPAIVSMTSLHLCLVSLVMVCDPPPVSGLLGVVSIRRLIDRAIDEFERADRSVAQRYEEADTRRGARRLWRRPAGTLVSSRISRTGREADADGDSRA